MAGTLDDLRLDEYRPTLLDVNCRRCKRQAEARVFALRSKYGNVTLGEVARLVATDGNPPCNLASAEGSVLCSAVPKEPSVERWATLSDARLGGWEGWLRCQRRHASLKKTRPCPGEFHVDVHTLLMVLEWDFPLERLKTRLQCPECGTKAISIGWVVPVAPAPPSDARARHEIGPTKPVGLRVVAGGKQR